MIPDDVCNRKDRKYEDGKAYIAVGNDWYSLDDLVLKKDILKLIDIFASYMATMYKNKGKMEDLELRSFSVALNNLRNVLQ